MLLLLCLWFSLNYRYHWFKLVLCFWSQVVDKFYKIRQHACRRNNSEESSWDDQSEDISWDDKCACLDDDSSNMWSFKIYPDASAADHIVSPCSTGLLAWLFNSSDNHVCSSVDCQDEN